MAYYSASRVGVSLDDKFLSVTDAKINVQPEVASVYKEDERTTNSYLPSQGVRGELVLNYFLSGKDFVKDYFVKDAPIKGNVGGLYFDSGYLTSYSFSFEQFKPVEISATIQFYGSPRGEFNPSSDYTNVSDVLDYSNASITSTGVAGIDRIISASYDFSSSVNVGYNDGSSLPTNVVYGSRTQSLSIETYGVSGKTVDEANDAAVEISFKDSNSNPIELFFVSGKVTDLSTSISAGQNVYSSFSISQDAVGGVPAITSLSTIASNVNTPVTINGANFHGVKDVFFFDTRVGSFEVNDAGTQITTLVPREAISGPIKVIGIGGVAVSSANFTVTNSIGVG